ncbi:hypothetical protein [Martelella alba]|uniref:hypothetical protein n=1 Tax=Martelella alba TaxID=2590451 RepID=UPI001AEDAFAB|nr:hypothetical protein [Martelella alba]
MNSDTLWLLVEFNKTQGVFDGRILRAPVSNLIAAICGGPAGRLVNLAAAAVENHYSPVLK